MNGLALCSGVGGLELGLSLALGDAYRTVCHVERETYCAEILARRMEEGHLDLAPIWDDLATFNGRPWRGRVDIVSGGIPCQPFSCAGKRLGTADDRWLWPQFWRVVRECGASMLFLENVRGFVHHGLGPVLGDLAAGGWDAEWGVFSAAASGAPHLRKRIFLLAHSSAPGWWASPEGRRDVLDGDRPRGQEADGGLGLRGAEHAAIERRGWWSVEPALGRVADGVPDRVDRLRACGNGVVPPVAARAFLTLAARLSAN